MAENNEDTLTAACGMFDKAELEVDVQGLQLKKEKLLIELEELRGRVEEQKHPLQKELMAARHENVETIGGLVKDFKSVFVLSVLWFLRTWCWQFPVYAVTTLLCWKFLEETRRRLEAEGQARKTTEELKDLKAKLVQSCISIADNVGIAEVDVTVGPVHTDLGNGATLIRKGGGMTVANGAQKATVKVELNVVTIRLGSGARMETIGGHILLDNVGNTEFNAKAEAENIQMGDNSQLRVKGVDMKSAEKNASIHKGPVNIQMGKNAQLEMSGVFPKDVRAVHARARGEQQAADSTWTLCVDDDEVAVLEADTLLSWKGQKQCQECQSQNICMKLGNKVTMFDLNGQHDVQASVCVCRDCRHRMSTPEDWYTERGFRFLKRGNSDEFLVDKDVIALYKAVDDFNQLDVTFSWRHENVDPYIFSTVLGCLFQREGDVATQRKVVVPLHRVLRVALKPSRSPQTGPEHGEAGNRDHVQSPTHQTH